MSFGGAVLLVLLAVVVVLGLVVAWLVQDRKQLKAKYIDAYARASAWKAGADQLAAQLKATAKIEEKRDEQKDAVAAGGFAASVGVLSDIAHRGKPKA